MGGLIDAKSIYERVTATGNVNIDEINKNSIYRLNNEITGTLPSVGNLLEKGFQGSMLFTYMWDGNAAYQVLFPYQISSKMFKRDKIAGVWKEWYVFTGTII